MSISISEFADRLEETMAAMAKSFSRHGTNELFKGKITLPQFLAMDYLHRNGESRMTDLARSMSVSTAGMTGIVDRLVRCGYIARGLEPKDRRVIKTKLTQRGEAIVGRIKEQRRKMIVHVFGKISEKDRDTYLRIITKVRETVAVKP
ncbi:MAG: MarR family transcriptional regulator [Candidatus Omnitrophota bacterium]